MRERGRCNGWRFPAIALAIGLGLASAAHGAEHWVDADPGPGRIAMLWKEGRLETLREGARAFTRIASDGSGKPSLAANASPYAPPQDARGRFVKLLLRAHDVDRLAGLELRLGSDGLRTHWFHFAVPLYADPEYNLLQDGEWTSITLSFGAAQLEGTPDRSRIDSMGLLVSDRGNGSVSIDLGGWALVDEASEGIASFTFDDGWIEHLSVARLMAKRSWRGTAYVIPALIGRPGHLGRVELTAMAQLGWDIAAHDDLPFTDIPPDRLVPALIDIQRWLVGESFARAAGHLAYPLGKQEPRRVRPEVRRRFATARLAGGGSETLPPGDPHLLRAVNVMPDVRPEDVGALARRAREHREWLILMLHHLVEKPAQSTDYGITAFGRLLEEVAKSGIRVAPVSEVWDGIAPPVAQPRSVPAAPLR